MMKTQITVSFILILIISLGIIGSSCEVSREVQNKSGTQLWGENCGRCHNPPGPTEFNHTNWDIIGTHMRVRANITETEEKKIIEYLKSNGG